MFAEAITLGAVFGGSALAVLLMKNKFHAQIERNLIQIERENVKVEEISSSSIHK